MNLRSFRWFLVILPLAVAVWLLWPPHQRRAAAVTTVPRSSIPTAQHSNATTLHASTALILPPHSPHASASTNKFAWRLTNTSKSLRELSHDGHAILLANALIDTRNKINFTLPKNLQSKGDPGAYIVQANGTITPAFRSQLAAAGAHIVSYIPNNAYLVQASAGQAGMLAGSGLTVLPYEPYYKVSSGLVAAAATSQLLSPGTLLNVGAFASSGADVQTEIQKLGGIIVAQDVSPFGPIFRVSPPADWTALAQLPGVQAVEPTYRRMAANDLSRVALGISEDTITNADYLDLYGSNVVVEVNDSGIDATHPDFTLGGNPSSGPGGGTRIFGDSAGSLIDTDGHGTFVAGIIAGNGAESWGVNENPMTNVGFYASGSISNADFRGKAPLASLFSVGYSGGRDATYNREAGTYNPDIFDTSDYYLQTASVSFTNALISNNSWTYGGDNNYDLAAASYDAAVRDALPTVTGSQPVLFVFAAGDDGFGNDDGNGANPDTIESPATAKNVITVGALQQARDITNIVTEVDQFGNSNNIAWWLPETESSTLVADYSARGNVGIGVEGDSGRFKPDLVAPGNFVVSTLSGQFNPYNYYNPKSYLGNPYLGQLVTSSNGVDGLSYYNVNVPYNAVGVTIQIYPNIQSPTPFPTNFPIYLEIANPPDPFNNPGAIDATIFGDAVNIPPEGPANYLQNIIASGGLWIAVGDPTNIPVNYDIDVTVVVTNLLGNYQQVLSNLNETLGPYYMYRSGTSMSAPAVSGVAALIQDFFTNTLHTVPSPALLKAMLINGARAVGNYQFAITNAPNDQGWGLPSLPNSLPAAWAAPLQASPPGPGGYIAPPTNAFFFQDQSPTNSLATGDSQTFNLTIGPDAESQPLRLTLTWTDPPGDPAAAIKLVNNLDIVVTNVDTAGTTNVVVYYGNDFSTAGNPNYSVPETTNEAIIDMVNNVRNIFLQPALGTNYSVTIVARSVNVNAVTAQTNSVVQDFALVISSGDGFSGVTNAFTVTANPVVTNPTADQDITIVTSTNTPLLNQIAGENSPLLGTNTVGVGTNSPLATNGLVTIGMTNQWHFYVVTNFLVAPGSVVYTNAAFITFFPEEMAVSRLGTLDDTVADATRPQGDIDMYVAKEPGLLNLDPTVISNCVNSVGGDAVSAGPNGTEFVAYSNSVLNQVYYIGIKSEDHLGTVFGFLPVFSAYPFSSMNADGSESVNGLTLPVNIPSGSPTHPGVALIFSLALYPLTINELMLTNGIFHQNFGDLSGQLTHGNISEILNSHDGFGNTTTYGYPGTNILYYDAGYNPINTPIGPVLVPHPHSSDGPGSLVSYQSQSAIGPWILSEVDNVPVHTGSNTVFGLRIYPHTPADKGLSVYIAGGGIFSDYIDVPAGVTNMTLNVTNETLPTTLPPLEVYLKFGSAPSPVGPNPTIYDQSCGVSNGVAPYIGGTISVGPASIPPINPGRYYYEIYNPSINPATNAIIATFSYAAVPGSTTFGSTALTPLVDDAVATNTIVITNTENIFSTAVGVVIDHPRVSDLTLTLVSPLNQRYTLVENRGGDTADMGHLDITTNFFGTASAGNGTGSTNVLGPVPTQGTLLIDYQFYTIPDNMDVYYGGVKIFSSGYLSDGGQFLINYGPGTATNIVIVMDQGGEDNTTLWTYTPEIVSENYSYLTLTDNTNLAQTLIKFAIPPFNLDDEGTNFILDNFELTTNGDYLAPTNIYDALGGWTLPTALTNYTPNFTNSALLVTNITTFTNNLVSVVTDPATASDGSNYLALGLGTILRNIPTIPTRQYTISYSYRGPGIAGWWRGEGNGLDSSTPETNGNDGELIGRFTFPAGEVGQAFGMVDQGSLYQFAGTNNYVQIRQNPTLDVGTGSGLTVEGWINPTNLSTQEPLVEWLSRMPTNAAVTNVEILAGPFLNRATDHYYYMLGETNWTTSERWATNMGGHLVTINDADEQNWVYDTFGNYGGTNRNLWIGLNDVAQANTYVWTSGQPTNYFNWVTGQPDSCGGPNGAELYTVMLGATNTTPGLWVVADQKGGFCTNGVYTLLATNGVYGVVELDTIPTNGVQFWVSVTNSPATGSSILSSNGCLYANLIDTTNGFHEIWSVPGLVQSNVYQHVALTYNTNSGVATLYYNGTNVCATNLGVFTPKTTGDILLGKDMSLLTNNFYSGGMDEMSIYGRCLSDAEIAAIYEVSAWSTNNPGTNGQVVANGKFDPQYNPAIGLAVADVTLDGRSSVILGDNTNWQRVDYTFVATSNSTPFEITGIAPGILLDDFTVAEAALGNLYYQPEEPLDGLVGESAAGTWTLEILDNRVGATNALAKLVSWQLQFVLQTNNAIPITLYPEMPGTNTVPPGDIAYFYVPIPSWSHWATNILVSATTNVSFLFNPTNPPTGSNPGDLTLLPNSTGGIGSILQTTNPPAPPLTSTNYYYLGVKNISGVPATVVVRVDFDITALTNGVPVQGTLTTNDTVRYFSFDVTNSNPMEATFQLLKLSGNADLVASHGTPLPTLTNFAYGSFNPSNADQNIYVQTNSLPVPLAPGRWYLGVFRRDPGPVTYSVLAKELDAGQTNVITLTNNVPFRFTTGAGAALTNFFLFNVTNAAQNVHFELRDMTGNGDLTVQSNGLPLMPPFYESSQEPGLIPEYIYLRTNNAMTNLMGQWYLGVPNHETNEISFTILAVNDSLLITNTTTAFPGAVGAAVYTTGGRGSTNIYHVTNLSDNGPGSLRYGVNAFTNNANIVFDVSGNIALQSPLVITNSNMTIAGQTAPGDGITLQNYQTVLQGATNVIIRYLRFRPGDTGTNVSPAFLDDFNGPALNPAWQTNLPNNAYGASPPGGASDLATYLGAPPNASFQTLGTNTVLRLTNTLGSLQRVGWSTASSFSGTNFYYDVRFNTLDQSNTLSIDAFIEIWIIDAANSNSYDIVSPFGDSYDGNLLMFAGSSIDGNSYENNYNYTNNGWYHLVLQCTGAANVRASLYDDHGHELFGYSLNHNASAFPAGFRLGLSQSVGNAGGGGYPVDVAVDYAKLTTSGGVNALASSIPGAGDSLIFTNAMNVMVDHVSASWSTNAVMSVLNSSNVTVQWSVIADSFHGTNYMNGLTNVLNGQGAALRYGHGSLSFNHNLYADNYSSSPEMGDNLVVDFVNNIVYNWGLLPGWSTTNDPVADPNGSTNELNFTCNYILASTNSATNYIAFWSGTTNTWVFQTNNFIDAYTNTSTNEISFVDTLGAGIDTNIVYLLNGSDTGWAMFTTNTTQFGDPFPLPYPGITNATTPTATAEEAYQAYEKVLDFAGDQLSRDSVDLSLMRHVRTQSGTFISSQSQVGGWPALSSQPAFLDTDQDGLPDYWEITFGLNPTNAADGAIVNTNTGYSSLETYLNWLAAPHALTTVTNPVSVDLYQLAGRTGRLSFYVTNALNGSVVLTNDVVTNYFYTTNGIYTNSIVIHSNTLAIFTPTNNYTSSFTNPASFDFYVTNNDTTAWFGPVTVSVVVSATNLFYYPPIVTLTNGVPFTVTNDAMYNFPITDSPGAVVFQLYNISGNATLAVQTNGAPVPPYVLASSTGTNYVQILAQTNFALTNIGSVNLSHLNYQWYLDVINNGGTNPLTYTIVAREIPVAPTIITLTNNVPFTWTTGPGPDLTNFFRYAVTNSADVLQFQLYDQSGNGDLTAQTNALPFAPEFYASSQQPGNNPELIQVPAGVGSLWYLGVPDNDPGVISYTILVREISAPTAVITNGSPVTNTIASGSTTYYLVNVPEYVNLASNMLVSATGPLDIWFSTNIPPTINNPGDALLLNLDNVASGTNVFGTNATPQAIGSAQLAPGSFYYLGVNNASASPVTYSLEVEFGLANPSVTAPTVITLPATSITAFAATLPASVKPEGATTTVYFAYGLTTNYGNFSTSVVLTTNLYSTYPVGIGISNLVPGSIYHFEAIGTNSAGTNYGGDLTLTNPPAAPGVTTVAATSITATTATLQAIVNPNGAVATVYFEYGTNTSYGLFSSASPLNSNLNTAQPVGIPVAGLLPGVIYHFQAIGGNIAGTNYGGDLTFTNLAAAPVVTTLAATNITSTAAKLQALVNPNGAATTLSFEYGTNTSYGSITGTKLLSTNLNSPQITNLFTGILLPGVTYHFQAIASNRAGTNYGGDLIFTTPPAAPAVVTLAATNAIGANATVAALVTPNGAVTTVYFVYGSTTNYGSTSTFYLLTGNLNAAQLVTNLLTGLQAGVNYHFQAVAFNSAGTNYGGDLTLIPSIPPVVVDFSAIIATNGGYLLSWYAPTNDQFAVQWKASLLVTNWNTFTNIVVYTGPATPTNGLFTYFDNGTQSGGFGPMRFYRLLLAPPILPTSGGVYRVNPLTTLVVTNTATNSNPNATLTYTVTGTLTGTNMPTVSTNGLVAWTPTLAQAGLTNIITTVVTENGVTPVTAVNSFEVIVNPLPYFYDIEVTVDGVLLRWSAASSNQFQIGWTTNLLTAWTYVPASAPYLTSPTTNFFYLDTNAPAMMKFYLLRQLP